MLLLPLAAAIAGATALPAGTVVLGVSTIDGASTDVVAVTPRGEREILTALDHVHGRLPKGVLVDGPRIITTAAVPDATGSVVEAIDLETGAHRVVATGAVALQAVHVDKSGAVTFVHQAREGDARFDVERVDGTAGASAHTVASFDGAWLAPAAGSDNVFLAIDAGGENRIVALGACPGAAHATSTALVTCASLGKGRYRSPAVIGDVVIVERDLDKSRAQVIDAKTGAVLHEGLPGMDPRALDGDAARIVLGAGKKRGAVIVARIDHDKLVDDVAFDAGTAGIATPVAASLVDGSPVVVAWLDRGASLPGEVVRISRAGVDVIAGPVAGAAFEVYGVVGAAGDARGAP